MTTSGVSARTARRACGERITRVIAILTAGPELA
jgi:hypothetical protein